MGIEKWRHGYDGLLAAILQRAKSDWDAMADISLTEARQLAAITKGNTLALDTCRFAISVGFDCPAQEIQAFLRSNHLQEWLRLADCEAVLERLVEED